jgi:hypothetical protein
MVCLTRATTLDGLDADALESFAAEVAAAPTITANHRKVIGSRLRALAQVYFQLGLIDTPPPHPNTRSRSLADHVAAIPRPRYVRPPPAGWPPWPPPSALAPSRTEPAAW